MHSKLDPDSNAIARGKFVAARTGRGKIKKRRRAAATQQIARPPPIDPDLLTLDQFCRQHNISRPFYYKLKAQGLGLHDFKLGSKTMISRDAAAAWRREREAGSQDAAHAAAQ